MLAWLRATFLTDAVMLDADLVVVEVGTGMPR
jgi:hypothetical protein